MLGRKPGYIIQLTSTELVLACRNDVKQTKVNECKLSSVEELLNSTVQLNKMAENEIL